MGLTGVAAGTAWAVGGVDAVGTSALAALRAIPILVVVVGVLNLLRVAVPRGGLAGPLVLVGVGALAIVVQLGVLDASQLGTTGPVLLIVGGVVVAMSTSSHEDPLEAVVTRCWSVFLPCRRTIRGVAPHKFIARCLFGDLRLDLARAEFPGDAHRVTVDVTICAGWLEIVVPHDWTVRAGRLQLAHRTQFKGEVSHHVPVLDVPQREDGPNLLVLNVQGWYGRVEVHRTQPPAAPPDSGSGRSEVA